MKNNLICFFVVLFLSSCAFKGHVNKETLVEYVNNVNNGLAKEVIASNIRYKIVYKPLDLIIEQELRANSNYKQDSLKNLYSNCLYFILSISRDSSDVLSLPRPDFTSLLKTISFELNNKIILTENSTNSVFYLGDFIYPRMYGSTRSASILLCFKDPGLQNISDFTISVQDFVNNSPHNLEFEFESIDLENIPKLKL